MLACVSMRACRERASNSKHVQLVSGTRPWLFWLATYLWDLVSFSISAAGIVLLIALYRLPQFEAREATLLPWSI